MSTATIIGSWCGIYGYSSVKNLISIVALSLGIVVSTWAFPLEVEKREAGPLKTREMCVLPLKLRGTYSYSILVQPSEKLDVRVYLTDLSGVIWDLDDEYDWFFPIGETRELEFDCEKSGDYYLIIVHQSGEGKCVVSVRIDVVLI